MERTAAIDQIRSLLLKGAPWEASDVFRSAAADPTDDPELLYWGALAYARSGATRLARTLLDRVTQVSAVPDAIRRDSLNLAGRLWKDRIDRTADGEPVGIEAARRARADYLAAFAIDEDSYPGTNAATLSMLMGETEVARALATRIAAALAAKPVPLTSWEESSHGEVLLLLGRFEDALACYRRACALAPEDVGSIATMRRQLKLIEAVIPEAATLLDALPAATVLTFAGHMIDQPGRVDARFPPWLEPAVAAALKERLAPLHRPLVYTSAACGADLLFIEAALAVDAEVNIVLPFDAEDFVRTSVAVGGAGWVERFERALRSAARVILATSERHLGDDVLLEHAQRLVSGLAILRASQLQTTPSMLCVLDTGSPAGVGGTLRAAAQWSQIRQRSERIDLAELRARAAPRKEPDAMPSPVFEATRTPAEHAPRQPQRTIKSTLFADMAGFGRLHDAQAPLFHSRFLGLIADQIGRCAVPPLQANTWGDGLYMVFGEPEDGAAFGMGLIDRMRNVDWVAAGLSDTSQIRIALHAGPVFCGFDPIVNRDNYFGTSVTQTARMEPVTPPGLVYASEAFVATLAARGPTPYVFEYVGELDLAKNYGTSRIYRLERR